MPSLVCFHPWKRLVPAAAVQRPTQPVKRRQHRPPPPGPSRPSPVARQSVLCCQCQLRGLPIKRRRQHRHPPRAHVAVTILAAPVRLRRTTWIEHNSKAPRSRSAENATTTAATYNTYHQRYTVLRRLRLPMPTCRLSSLWTTNRTNQTVWTHLLLAVAVY